MTRRLVTEQELENSNREKLEYEKLFDEITRINTNNCPLAETIKNNLLKLKVILNDNNISENLEYKSKNNIYNSISEQERLPVSYINDDYIDITNFLRSGIVDDYLKNRGGDIVNHFHYYKYIDSKRPLQISRENYLDIFRNHMILNAYTRRLIHNDYVNRKNSFRMVIDDTLYNIPRVSILETAYFHFEELSIKYKFDPMFFNKLSGKEIISICLLDESQLIKHKRIKYSIRKTKIKKEIILGRVRHNFNGNGSIWKFICSSDTVYLKELQFIASINGIKNTELMTKTDLCTELENLSIKKKTEQLPTCENDTDIGGDDIKDVPAEFFYSYEMDGRSYCTDIRTAYANIKSGNLKNPYTNVKIPQNIVNEITDLYSTIMETKVIEPPTLTQLLANFSSRIPYLNNVELYKNANLEDITNFYKGLYDLGLSIEISQASDTDDFKYKLIDTILKLRNFDDAKYYIRSIYNTIFKIDNQ